MPRKRNWKKAVVKMKKSGVCAASDGGLALPSSPSAEGEPSVSESQTGVLVVSDGGLAHPFTPSGASVSQSLPCSLSKSIPCSLSKSLPCSLSKSLPCSILEANLDSSLRSYTECKPSNTEANFDTQQQDPHLRELKASGLECIYYATPLNNVQNSNMTTDSATYYNSNVLNATKSIFGTFHQGNAMFSDESRGSQCVGNSICALLYAYNTQFEIDEGMELDRILIDGDCLYRKIIFELKSKGIFKNKLITFDEIPSLINVSGVEYSLQKSEIISGVAIQISDESGLPSLQESICQAFLLSDHILGMIGAICSAVFKKNSTYYFFDSHSHGKDGLSSCDGVSVLFSFECIDDLICYMYSFYESGRIDLESQFEILPIIFSDLRVLENAHSKLPAQMKHLNFKNHIMKDGCRQTTKTTCENDMLERYFKDQKEKKSFKDQKRNKSLHEIKSQRKDYFKEYKRRRRCCIEFKTKEMNLKREARNSDSQRLKEKASTKKTMDQARDSNEFKLKELSLKQKSRMRPEQREKDKASTKKSMDQARNSNEFKLKELSLKQKSRIRPEQREKDKASTKKSMDQARDRNEFKLKELSLKQKSRMRPEQREKDKASTKKAKDQARDSNEFKLKELSLKQKSRVRPEQREKDKASTKKAKDIARDSNEFKLKELSLKQKSRMRPEQREKDKASTKKSMDQARDSNEFKLKELSLKQKSRMRPEQREKDKGSTKKSMNQARESAEFRLKESSKKQESRLNFDQRKKDRASTLKSKKREREDETYRMIENESKRKMRKSETMKAKEIIYQRASKAKARSDPYIKEKERIKKQEWRSCKRNKHAENAADAGRKASKRRNQDFRRDEICAAKKRKCGSDIDECIKHFEANIANGPVFICTCCHQTWFKQSVSEVKTELCKLPIRFLTNLRSVDGKEWICLTCKTTISSGKVPKLSVLNGMSWPNKPKELDLHPLEERLIALCIPFMQIRELPRGRQLSIKGNVINVPVNIQPVVNVLPRPFNENVTVAVKLKKKISFKSCVFSENVRPLKVLNALDWLLKTSDLYKDSNIKIDHDWTQHVHEQRNEVTDEFLETISPDNENTCSTTGSEKKKVEELYDSDAEEVMQENVGNIDTMVQDANEENRNCMFTFAPGEGQQPLSIYQDKDSEYLCFPTIFCGKRRKENEEREVPINYSDIAKWELRSRDRRSANSVPNIFFKLKKIQMKQLNDKVNLAVRRCQTDGRNMTAANAKDASYLNNVVKQDEGYYIFKQLRNSPAYLETRKKDVFAMIRQLGLPTWFMSLSSADTRWIDLLKILSSLNDNTCYSDEEIQNLTWEQKIRLIQKDPVTCSRYFDHRVQQFINVILKSDHQPLGKVTDFFYRVEFQQRGSPHIHMLVWIENAPKFNKNTNEEIVDYVDKYLQCSNLQDEIQNLTDLQVHKHSRTCRKKQDRLCRFGYPLPPLGKTEVFDPLEEDQDKYQKMYNELQKKMNDEKDGYQLTYEEFLHSVAKMTEGEYIKCIRSSLKASKVFLKRKPNEIRVNMYNRSVLKAWKANIDIQFVLDPYACAMYIVSYISKSQRGMSNLLHAAVKEARNGNLDIKKQVRHIGNIFSNSVEVSAQEAVYLVLQMPLTKCTRDVTFINTSTQDKRIQLLKSKSALDELPDQSTDIMCDNIFNRYARRPKALANWCLADYVSQLDVSYPDLTTNELNDEQNDDQSECANELFSSDETILSLNSGITIRRRKSDRVIRYVRFNKKTDEENYFREKLLLFLPWRNEKVDLLSRYSSYKEHYETIRRIIDHKSSQYEHHVDEIDLAREQAEAEHDAYDEIAPSTQQAEGDTMEEQSVESEQFIYFNPDRVNEHKEYDIGIEIGCSISSAQVNVNENILSDDEYRKLLRCLNTKQRQFYNHVIHWIKTNDAPLYAFLSGGAGVGKSVVIRALYQTLYRVLNLKEGQNADDIRILLCAYTGKAAFNIGGSTISSAFKQKYKQSNQTLTCDSLNSFRSKYRDLSVVIIDEISMVSSSMLSFIDQRLQELKGTRLPFGGVSLIAVGDLYQLKPVSGDWIFNDLTHGAASLSSNLWKEHFKVFELTEIMRQKDDQEFAEILNRLRVDALTDEDKVKLERCKVSKNQNDYMLNAPHLFAENYFMHLFNESIIDSLHTEKVMIPSHDSVISPSLSKDKQKHALAGLPTDPSITANLHSSLTVVVNMIYDLTVNINTEDGLANGASCTVKFIEYKLTETNRPSIIWVQFHEQSAGFETRDKFRHRGYYHKDIDVNWTPVFDVERTYIYNKKTFKRIQFPLQPSAGRSVHRAQGSTLDSVVIDLSQRKTRKVPHLHYVAISRVKSMAKLQIINFNEKAFKIDSQVQVEMDRLLAEAKLELCFTPLDLVDANDNFKIAFNNCRSLHLHFEDVKADSNLVSSHVFGLAETRLFDQDVTSDYDLSEFHLIRNDQNHSSGNRPPHGLCVYINKQVNIKSHISYTSKTVEFMLVNVTHCSFSFQIAFIYKSPGTSKQNFITCLQHNLIPHLNMTEQLVIMGDFNIDYSEKNKEIWKEIQSLLSCKVLIEKPTTNYMSILDIVLSNCHGKAGVLEAYWSDHKVVYFHSK